MAWLSVNVHPLTTSVGIEVLDGTAPAQVDVVQQAAGPCAAAAAVAADGLVARERTVLDREAYRRCRYRWRRRTPSPMKASPLVTTPPSPPMARLPVNVLPVTVAVDPDVVDGAAPGLAAAVAADGLVAGEECSP